MTSNIPFSEPPFLDGLPSPYYNETHIKWQKACREFVTPNLVEKAFEWEDAGDVPSSVYQKFAQNNFLLPSLPAPLPINILKKHGITHLPGGLRIEDYDYLHFLIFMDEVSQIEIAIANY